MLIGLYFGLLGAVIASVLPIEGTLDWASTKIGERAVSVCCVMYWAVLLLLLLLVTF